MCSVILLVSTCRGVHWFYERILCLCVYDTVKMAMRARGGPVPYMRENFSAVAPLATIQNVRWPRRVRPRAAGRHKAASAGRRGHAAGRRGPFPEKYCNEVRAY